MGICYLGVLTPSWLLWQRHPHQLPGLVSYCSSPGDPSAQSLRGFREQCRQVWKHHLSFIHSPWQVIWEGHLVDPTAANLSMSPRWEGDAHRFWILPFTSSEVREHRRFPLYSSKFLHFLELPLRGRIKEKLSQRLHLAASWHIQPPLAAWHPWIPGLKREVDEGLLLWAWPSNTSAFFFCECQVNLDTLEKLHGNSVGSNQCPGPPKDPSRGATFENVCASVWWNIM